MILIDANIWIYALDRGFGHAHDLASQWLSETLGEAELLLPALVETEVIHYLGRQVKVGEAETLVSRFMSHPGEFAELTASVNRRAAKLLLANPDRGIGGRDAVILVHAKDADATVITHDNALFGVAADWGLDAHDPIQEPPA